MSIASTQNQPPFLGEGRHKIVDGLENLLSQAEQNKQAVWVSIEAPSGWGKTRLAHALYGRLASKQKTAYWPAEILEGSDVDLFEVASRRKRVYPEKAPDNRAAKSLPDFFWWGIACDMRNGVATQALRQDIGQVYAHAPYLEAAWAALAKAQEKYGVSLEQARNAVMAIVDEAAGIGLEKIGEALISASLPGMGLVVDMAKFGYGKLKAIVELNQLVSQAGVASKENTDIVDDAARTINRLARPGLPVVIFIEDIHKDDGLVALLLGRLLRNNAPILIMSTTWPGEIERSEHLSGFLKDSLLSQRIHRLRYAHPMPEAFPMEASMDELPKEALKALIRSYYPATSEEVLAGLSARYNNPLPIEIICTMPKHRRGSSDGALKLSEGDIKGLPTKVRDLYRELWNELPEEVRCILALATLAIPEKEASWHQGMVRHAIDVVAERISDNPALVSGDSDVPHGWVRDVKAWLRRFNEPDQLHIAREEIEQQELFGDDVIEAFLDDLVSALVGANLGEISEESEYQAWLILALRHTGKISDDTVLDAILLLSWGLSGTPLEIKRRLKLGELFSTLNVDQESIPAIRVRGWYARAMADAGKNQAAHATYEALLPVAQRLLGEEHPEVLAIRNNIASQLGHIGRPAEAYAYLEALLPVMRKVLGDENVNVLMTRNSMGYQLGAMNRPAEAQAVFEALLPDVRRLLGADHPYTLMVKNNMAVHLGALRRSEEAYAELASVLADRRRILGDDHPDVLHTRVNIASQLAAMNRSEEANKEFGALIPDLHRVLGDDHPDVLVMRRYMAVQLGALRRSEEAYAELVTLLPDMRRVFGDDHPEVLVTRNNIAYFLSVMERSEEAYSAFETLLKDQLRVLGADHHDVLITRCRMAVQLGAIGHDQEAYSALDILLPDLLRKLGANHPDVLNVSQVMASLREKLGFSGVAADFRDTTSDSLIESLNSLVIEKMSQPEVAYLVFEERLPEQRRRLGDDHPEVLEIRKIMAFMLNSMNRHADAYSAYETLLPDQVRALGADHKDVLSTRYNISFLLHTLGRHADAYEAAGALLLDQRRILGDDHPEVLELCCLIAIQLSAMGRKREAYEAFELVLSDMIRVHGDDHPETVIVQNHLKSMPKP